MLDSNRWSADVLLTFESIKPHYVLGCGRCCGLIIIVWNGKIDVKEKRDEKMDFIRNVSISVSLFVVIRKLRACWRNPSLFSYQQMTSYIEGGRVWKNGKPKFTRSARMTLKGEIKITWGGLEFLRLVNSPQGCIKDDSIRLNWKTKTFSFRKPKNRFYRDQNGFREISRFYLYRYFKFD